MPNENISCASTGNSTQFSSTRKDKKPFRIRASILYDGRGPGSDPQAGLMGIDPLQEAFGNTPTNLAELERMLLKERKTNYAFDAAFSMHIESAARSASTSAGSGTDGDTGPESSAFESGIARALQALYSNILSVNAPDKFLELITIETIALGTAALARGVDAFLEAESQKLRHLLESAGYSVQNVQTSFAERFDTVSRPALA